MAEKNQGGDPQVIRVQKFFGDAEWKPNAEPIEVGAAGYMKLSNLMFDGKRLEVVDGATIADPRGVAWPDYEHFSAGGSGWTEVDTSARATLTTSNVNVSGLLNTDTLKVYREMSGTYPMRGRWAIAFKLYVYATSTSGAVFDAACCMSSDGEPSSQTEQLPGLRAKVECGAASFDISLITHNDSDTISGLAYGTLHEFVLVFDGYQNNTGHLYLTDSDYLGITDSASVDCVDSIYKMKYVFATASGDGAGAIGANYYVSLLRIIGLDEYIESLGHLFVSRADSSYTYALVDGGVYRSSEDVPFSFSSTFMFSNDAQWTDADDAGTGFFTRGLDETILYTNGAESCIASGDERRVDAAYVVAPVSETLTSGISFTAPDQIDHDRGAHWFDLGFRAGMTIEVDGSTNNDGFFTIETISDSTITVVEQGVITEASASCTVKAGRHSFRKMIDVTEIVNGDSQSSDEYISITSINDETLKAWIDFDNNSTDKSYVGATFSLLPGGTPPTYATGGAEKVGSHSILFDAANSQYVQSATGSDEYSPEGDTWSVDFWVKLAAGSTGVDSGLFGVYEDANNFLSVRYDWDGSNAAIEMTLKESGSVILNLKTPNNTSLSTPSWVHVCCGRGWGGDGDVFFIALDGDVVATKGSDITFSLSTPKIEIGRAYDNGASAYDYADGYIDELVYKIGDCRFTVPFSTPDGYPTPISKWNLLLMSTRPLSGCKMYVKAANTSNSAMSFYHWVGNNFKSVSSISDGTTSVAGKSLSGTGSVSWTSTVDTARRFYVDDTLLFAYLMEQSGGADADIYQVTLNAPFQKIVDNWDAVFRTPIKAIVEDGGVIKDYTYEVNDDTLSSTAFAMDVSSLAVKTDKIRVWFTERQTAIVVKMVPGDENDQATIAHVSYNTKNGFRSVHAMRDTTNSGLSIGSLSQSGGFFWAGDDYDDEIRTEDHEVSGYCYEITFSGTAIGADVNIDRILGVPAAIEVDGFRSAVRFRDRVFLLNRETHHEVNRIDYCLAGATDVWSGQETSRDGFQSLYVGSGQPLTCGAVLFNRYGSNYIDTMLVLSAVETSLVTGTGPDDFRVYPVSSGVGSVGCPAPKTLVTAEVGFEVTGGAQRNIAMWLSYSGPVMFDAATIIPIGGVDVFFQPNKAPSWVSCIDYNNIDKAVGWYDPAYRIYYLIVPTGAETFIGLGFQLVEKKWFQFSPGLLRPRCATLVEGANGDRYPYIGCDGGFLYRWGYGQTWDGAYIDWQVETGDFSPTGSFWDVTTLDWLNLLHTWGGNANGGVMTIYHGADGGVTDSALKTITAANSTLTIKKDSERVGNKTCWLHRLNFYGVGGSAGSKRSGLVAWEAQFIPEREDK
jgi:hypothetical protein